MQEPISLGKGCERATAYALTNKIVTWRGKTHAVWLDACSLGYRVRIRTYEHNSDTWSPVYTVGEAYDNHGSPALTVDSQGFLHALYYPHHHRFCYSRSQRPNDASAWEDEVRFGTNCTYPSLVCAHDDTLVVACRGSFTEEPYPNPQPWVVNLYRKPPGAKWEGPTTVATAQRNGYANFQQSLCWGPDHKTLHMSMRVLDGRHTRGQDEVGFAYGERLRGHTVGYLRSTDLGQTWQRSDGSTVTPPVTAETIDIIERDFEGTGGPGQYQCGAIAVDEAGTPHVLFSRVHEDRNRLVLAVPDGTGGWQKTEVWQASPCHQYKVTDVGGVVRLPSGRFLSAVTLLESNEGEAMQHHVHPAWGHPDSRVALVDFAADGSDAEVSLIHEPADLRPHWLPTLERPTGFNEVAEPAMLFTAGEKGTSCFDKIATRACFVGFRR